MAAPDPSKRRALLEALLVRQNVKVAGATTIPRRPASSPTPLSFGQERLWFLEQSYPGMPVYNMPVLFSFRGPLDVAALERSLNDIVRRHEILRTTFVLVDGQPMQRIGATASTPLPVIDLRGLPSDQRASESGRLVRDEARKPFDLLQGPLMRAELMRIDDELHQLLLTMHHIVFDGWSFGVFATELHALYSAYAQSREPRLPELAVQYADFAIWQREWLQGEIFDKEVDYWRGQLAGLPLLNMPTDRPRPPIQTFEGSKETLTLSRDVRDKLRAIGHDQHATLFTTVLAGFATLLHRYTGQTDISIGAPFANRSYKELEALIGFFVNTLVMRVDLSDNPRFTDLLGRVRTMVLNATAHQHLPFEKLVEVLRPERDPSRTPLFQVGISLQHNDSMEFTLPGLVTRAIGLDNDTAKFDLMMFLAESERGMVASLNYNAHLFKADTIQRMLGHFQTLLEGIAAHPDRPVAELPLLTEPELQQQAVWAGEVRPYPHDRCIHQLFEEQVQRSPEVVATVFRERRLTYRELNACANRLAARLREVGVGPESIVGVCLDGSLEVVVSLLGILKAGGVYMPLDRVYPKERLASMMQDGDVRVVLTQQHLRAEVEQIAQDVLVLEPEVAAGDGVPNPAPLTNPDNACYVIFTSGSTGRPKGVVLAHRGLVNLITFMPPAFRIDAGSRVLQFASLSFDVSVLDVFQTLLVGGTLFLERRENLAPGEPLIRLLKEYAITAVVLAPSVWKHLPDADLPALRSAIAGGEACPASVVERWAPGRMFFNGYGPTEITITSSLTECFPDGAKPSIGRPLPNVEYYVVDRNFQLCPVGVPGELLIGGVGLARGYLKRPELTADKFIPHLFARTPGQRLYRTGDLVRLLSNGEIEYLERIDSQVKIHGLRIELGEIESVLAEHPAVTMSAVTCYTDAGGDQQLAAYIVAKPAAASPSPDDLRAVLSMKLPKYMLPHVFVFLEAMPLTPSGKIDKKALPSPSTAGKSRSYTAPRDTLEQVLADIWGVVLKSDRVGIHDDFFEVGGHSLLVTRVTSKIRDALGIDLPITTLFTAPTIAKLSESLRQSPQWGDEAEARLQLLAQVAELSDEEVAQALDELTTSPPLRGGVPEGRGGEGVPEARSAPAARHPLLLPLNAAGTRRPVFLMHPGSGNCLCYIDLIQRIKPEQPVYGIQAAGLDGGQPMLTSVEEMATLYLKAIRTVQPQGPYTLGGWSFGGLLGLEMAQQLLHAGQTVDLLIAIDTQLPPRTNSDEKNALLELSYAWDMANFLNMPISLEALQAIAPGEHLPYLIEMAEKTIMPPGFEVEHLRQSIMMFQNNTRAMFRYSPRVYSGAIALLQGSERFLDEIPAAGWSGVARGSLDIRTIPGSHYTILKPPHVNTLAGELDAYMSRRA
jgi:amino acid adenylation domain-containing protein